MRFVFVKPKAKRRRMSVNGIFHHIQGFPFFDLHFTRGFSFLEFIEAHAPFDILKLLERETLCIDSGGKEHVGKKKDESLRYHKFIPFQFWILLMPYRPKEGSTASITHVTQQQAYIRPRLERISRMVCPMRDITEGYHHKLARLQQYNSSPDSPKGSWLPFLRILRKRL